MWDICLLFHHLCRNGISNEIKVVDLQKQQSLEVIKRYGGNVKRDMSGKMLYTNAFEENHVHIAPIRGF